MTEDNKLKLFTEELKMLQDIIKRMADNSFKIKAWTITLVGVAIIFRSKIDSVFVSFIPLIMFFILDTYYLSLEQKFRKLYDEKVDKFQKGDFEEIFKFNIKNENIPSDIINTCKSKSIWFFYGGIFILVLVFNCLIQGVN